MELSEFIIIYLACGAPFAVYRATSGSRRNIASKWLGVVLAITIWPFIAVETVLAHFQTIKAGYESPLEDIRVRIEEAAFPDKQMQSVFEFRETFYRFVGLAQARTCTRSAKAADEIFTISGLSPAPAAPHCLARRNRARLERHFELAKDDFLSTIAELAGSSPNASLLNAMTIELAGRLGVNVSIITPKQQSSNDAGSGLDQPEPQVQMAATARAGS